MDHVRIQPSGSIGRNFISGEFLPPGKDEHYLRNTQNPQPANHWRKLTAGQIECLLKNGNTADNWDNVLVAEPFDPKMVSGTRFYGLVRIGRLRDIVLEHHDLQIPAGIQNSTIVSCDIGDDVAIRNVSYLAHYIIGNQCILANINEMHTTSCAKFGNGVHKDGRPEKSRLWLDLMNESGCRRVMPFDGMIGADAYLWARYRDDKALLSKLQEITQRQFDSRRGYYGTVGDQCVIMSSRCVKDVKIGPCCSITSVNTLNNLTINSSFDEPTHIGEGVELVDGIIGLGSRVSSAARAFRFVLGANCKLDCGARLVHSFVADNSTVAGCEVQNSLLFCAHEQHHNNSFLIASLVMGQSNIAAGATIGSNHNSRANDLEVQAGRGFWPGLCTSVKHPSRFASYTLLSKGDYPCELDIPLPFSLLNNNASLDQLEVMPAFWWLHNMYALARNLSKFQSRDKRKTRTQQIEFEPLAPDTVEEILHARFLLECWTAKAKLKQTAQDAAGKADAELAALGRKLLNQTPDALKGLEVLGKTMENSKRKTLIVKPFAAYHAYGQMLLHYAIRNLLAYMQFNTGATFESMKKSLQDNARRQWVNLGGQLVPTEDVDRLRADIASGKLNTWQAIHQRYDELWQAYPLEKQRHAFAVLRAIYDGKLESEQWQDALNRSVTVQEYVRDQVRQSRLKDFENPFRRATCRSDDEMIACLGTIDDNAFVQQVRAETDAFKKVVTAVAQRG